MRPKRIRLCKFTPALNTNWIVNSYDSAGRRVTTGGTFEGVIETTTGGIAVRTFRYLSSATQLEVVLTV